MCPSFGSIRIESHRAEVFVMLSLAEVEKVGKTITKDRKPWVIHSKLPVRSEWMTVNLRILLKIHPAAYRWKSQVISMVPRFAVSQSDDLCLYLCKDSWKWMTADISCLIVIKRKFFDGKVVWWYLSEHITRILHDIYANYCVITYD